MTVFGPKRANLTVLVTKWGKRDFWEKEKMSLPYAYYAAALCKKPEQTYERILRSSSDERTDGWTRVNS